MDSETAAAAKPISKENGGGSLSYLEPPVVEDDYETASEDSIEETSMVVENGENPNRVLSGSPNPDGDSDVPDERAKEVEISGGGSNQEVPDSDGRDEKDEDLGGGSNAEVPNSAVGMEGDSKAEGLVVGVEGNGAGFAQYEKKDEGLDGDGESEAVATRPVLEGEEKAESKPETEKIGAIDTAADAESEKDVATDIVGCDQNLEGTVEDSKPVEVELNAADAELVESKAVEEEEINVGLKPVAEAEKDVAIDIIDYDQNLEGEVEDSKPVEVELNAADAKQLDDVVEESKAVGEEETNIAVDEKETDAVDGSLEPKAVEEEINAVAAKENGATDRAKAVEEEISAAEAVKNEAADGAGKSLDLEIQEEKVASSSEAKPSDGCGDLNLLQDVEPPPTLAEDSKSKETETELLEKSGIPESGAAHEVPVESMLPVSVEKVEPDADGSHVADDNENDARTAPEEEEEERMELLENSVVTESENSVVTESEIAPEISVESMLLASVPVEKVQPDADVFHVVVDDDDDDDDENTARNETEEEEEDDDNVSDQQPRVAILDSSETAKQIIKEMEEGSSSTSFESSQSYQHQMDGQIVSDSDEEVDTDEEGDGKEIFDTAALAALLKAATGASSDGSITITSQDGSRVFSMDRPAGLGSSAPALRPAPTRSARPTLFSPSELEVTGETENEMDEEERKLHQKVEDIRVKFLRLVMRLGHTPEDTVAAQVLYRLSLAEGIRRGRQMSRAFSIETAKKKAILLEAEGDEDLKFSCNILVLGKTGVGKSATINSIFGEEKSHTNAFQAATSSVREILGVVDGVKIRVIDTPGLGSSVMDQPTNRRILSSIKKYTKKCPPDIVLYVDRLDNQTRDFNDLPMLKSITSALGSSIWFNAIVALTHAASAPPEGPNGSSLSYEVFIAQRSHVVQHSIRQAAGDMRLMNPVALVENHPSCRKNREGQRVLPNGLSWRPQMLLLCYSSKILSEANSLLKLQDPPPGKLFGFRFRSPPLPYLLSTLLQSRPHPKLSTDQGGDNGDSDIDLDDFSDGEDEEEDEYDQLPPFKPLKRSHIAKLTKEQKRAYFDEYDYRVKLLQKKQFKEEIKRLKEMKKKGKNRSDYSPFGDMGEDFDQDGAPAAVPVPLPDMVLPPSFDCDVPTYRYRFLEPTSQLLTRPVLDTHGWDHDCGYDGVSLEESLAIANRFPAAVAVQITKDKKDFNIHLDSSISAKHGENGSSLAGFDIQSVGKQLAYILRSETKFKNLKKNRTAAGISVTFLGETVATGLKVEDQLMIGKRVGLVASTGAVRAQGDVAYGANLEARLREKDYPIGQALSTLGLSLMKWRGDLALGANLQSQVNIGRNSKVAVRVGLNNKKSGQITIRTSTSEQLQLALVGIIPVALSIFRSIWPGESDFAH